MQYLTSRNMSSIATPKIHKMGNNTPTAVVDSTPWMQPPSTAMTDQYYSSSSNTSPLLNSDNDNLYLPESNSKSHRSRTSTSDMCVEKNTEGKPPYSYATLIKYAIERSAENKLTLSQIYQWVIDHYPYYGSAGSGWKVCVCSHVADKSVCANACIELYPPQPLPQQELCACASSCE